MRNLQDTIKILEECGESSLEVIKKNFTAHIKIVAPCIEKYLKSFVASKDLV